MNQYEIVRAALTDTFRLIQEADGVRLTTQCIYPSNGFVQVVVRGGADTFFVSDEGGALREIEAAGGEVRNPDRLLRHLVAPYNLRITNGVICSTHHDAASIGLAVALVANVSKTAAEWLFSHLKIRPHTNFKAVVADFLRTRYQSAVRE